MQIEVILSPDLRMAQRREDAKALRLEAAKRFKIGDRVKAGETGKPGILEKINDGGFADIRWPEGSVLCGVEATDLLPA